MNERIRELAEEAGIVPGVMGLNRFTYFDTEKFAELIVKECAELCLKYAEYEGLFNEMEFRKGQHFNTIIKNHFGVKE